MVARIESKLDWPCFDMYPITPCNPSRCSEKGVHKNEIASYPTWRGSCLYFGLLPAAYCSSPNARSRPTQILHTFQSLAFA